MCANASSETDRTERRMLAIMASDVVGYSRAMEIDEAATISRVTRWQSEVLAPTLERHHGRLVKLIGDGALAVFDSVVDAVVCAAEVQRATGTHEAGRPEPLRLRIGINLGDVVLVDGDVYGDGVNVAARLEQICDPGGIMISGTAFDHLQGKLGFPLEFAGEQQVKNISRPVRAYRAQLDGKPRSRWRRFHLPRRIIAAAAVLVLLLVGGWWFWENWWVQPANASIAVLPFDNLGGDDATRRLADGMTEDIITELTRFRALDVIARDATLAYKDTPVDVRDVGRRLQVRYVLDGAIQRQGDRVRISARLVDAANAHDVWSDRWDRTTEDLFAVQSELAEEVASQIASPYSGQITTADRDAAKRKPPRSLTAYDLYLLGMEAHGTATREGFDEAIRLLKQSVTIDPGFARAWTGLALTYGGLAEMTGYPADLQAARQEAAQKAVALDPADASAHAALATYYMDTRDAARAESEFDKALRLNPGSADLLSTFAGWASNFGEPEEGVAAADRAIRLNPDTPAWALYNFGYAYFMAGRYDDALRMFNRMPADTYTPNTYVYRAATLGALGDTAAAKRAVADATSRAPRHQHRGLRGRSELESVRARSAGRDHACRRLSRLCVAGGALRRARPSAAAGVCYLVTLQPRLPLFSASARLRGRRGAVRDAFRDQPSAVPMADLRGRRRSRPGVKPVLTLVVAVAAVLVCAWLAVVGALWWQQDRMIFPGWGYAAVEASGVDHPDQRLELTTPGRSAPRRCPAARDAAQSRPHAGIWRQCRGCRLAAASFRRLARRCRHRDLLLPRLRAQRRGAERAGPGRGCGAAP